jgi:hypothetical protein
LFNVIVQVWVNFSIKKVVILEESFCKLALC